MAARPCNISLTGCAGADSPITNISAEAPDPLLFAGIPYDPFDWHAPPRLGNGLKVDADCPNFLASTFANYSPVIYAQTQLMANLQALAAELGCTWPENGDQIYTNDAQTATVYCPDGTAFTYTVDAGTLTSPLLDTELGAAFVIAANAWAAAYAFEQASALMDCIDPDPDTPPEPGPRKPTIPLGPGILPGPVWMCFGQEFFHRYRVSGRGAAEYTLSITAGALPPGTTFTQDGPKTGFISGTPTAPGEYSFTITGVSTSLPTVTVEVTDYVWVMGITNADTLPSAITDIPYSEQLLGTGGTSPYTFVTADALPIGLILASDGIISGTPTAAGDFTFDVTITDENDGECTQTVYLSVSIGCVADTHCNAPQNAPCVFPDSITFTDWNARKVQIIAPTADPALGQTEWDGTLPVVDNINFPGTVRWYPAGTAWPVVVGLSYNGLKGTSGGITLDGSSGSWIITLEGYVSGVPTVIWQGEKTAGVTPDGTYMRIAGLSAGPDCFHATCSTTSAAVAWWTMQSLPFATVDSACGHILNALEFVWHSIIAGHVNNALRIHCEGSLDNYSSSTSSEFAFTDTGITIAGWVRSVYTISSPGSNSELIRYIFYVGGVYHSIEINHAEGGNWICSLDGAGLINKAFAVGWHYLVVQYNPLTGTLGFDVDQAGITTAAVASLSADVSANTTFRIGNSTSLTHLGSMDTDFDEFAIYNGILTTSQLDCIYNAGTGTTW